MNPKVSIVIPVYNGANYMRDAIDSALNQTYGNCEVIVINDGSRDNGQTEAIAKSYGDRIRYFYKENGGVATAVNLGIEKMTGEYFAWLSHDDMFTPDKIEKQIQAIEKVGEAEAIVHSNFDFLYVEENRSVKVDMLAQYTKKQLEDSCFAPLFLAIHGSTILIHKNHFKRVGVYDTNLRATQDSEFLFRVMRGQRSVFVEDSLMISRIHKEQGQQTMACHVPEYNQMFVDFCEMLTEEEKVEMCGSVGNFYYRLFLLLKYSKPANKILDYLKDKIRNTKLSCQQAGERIMKKEWQEQGINEIYIWGAGQYGKETLLMMESFEIEVNGFIDNDVKKQGTLVNGIQCFPPASVYTKKDVLVIVAMAGTDEVVEQVKVNGVCHVTTIGEVKKKLFKVMPSRIIIQGDK